MMLFREKVIRKSEFKVFGFNILLGTIFFFAFKSAMISNLVLVIFIERNSLVVDCKLLF